MSTQTIGTRRDGELIVAILCACRQTERSPRFFREVQALADQCTPSFRRYLTTMITTAQAQWVAAQDAGAAEEKGGG